MIVSRERKLAFVHIPKTAGSSLTRVLSPFVDKRDRTDHPRLEGPGWQTDWHLNGLQHVTFQRGLEQMRAAGLEPGEFRFFTVVRCPFTWIRSIYENFYARELSGGFLSDLRFMVGSTIRKASGGLFPIDRFRMFPSGDGLEGFLEFLDQAWQASWTEHAGAWGFQDQSRWLESEDDTVRMELVGRFEKLDGLWAWLWTALDEEPEPDPPHVLKREGPRLATVHELGERHLEIVRRRFHRDFERFGYALDPEACKGGR